MESDVQQAGAGECPEPLTHRNSAGEVYQRSPLVEKQIVAALRLGAAELRARAAVQDRSSPAYLQEECLVYLIRHYHRLGDANRINVLAEALLRRCASFIDRHLRKLGADAAIEGYENVIERLFSQILDLDSDRGDFLQVRFWPALTKLTIHEFHQQLLLRQRAQSTVAISSLPGYDREDEDETRPGVRPGDDASVATPAPDQAVIVRELIRDALRSVDEPFRTAFLLRYYLGWPIEDQDPTVPTISRRFGKDPRTIRNWLTRARKDLERWRGEQR